MRVDRRWGIVLGLFLLVFAQAAAAAQASHGAGPALAGIPLDFILFAFTLLGVALFHRHTLAVALTGLATIGLYKLAFTGFPPGPGLPGLVQHLRHEWVILANLDRKSTRLNSSHT